jgi:hypothetical protein
MTSYVQFDVWQSTAGINRQTVLQIVSTNKTSSFVGTSVLSGTGYFVDVTGMAATITPTSTTSKILVMLSMYVGVTQTASGYQQAVRVRRNGSYPIQGDQEGTRPRVSARINMYSLNTYSMQMLTGCWLDSPASTTALTYQIELGGYSGSPIVYVNRSETYQDGGSNYDGVPVSTLTLMEIAQ